MDGWVLLAIGVASLALVCVTFAYLGYTAYRLVKAGVHVTRTYGAIAAELTPKAALAAERAARAGADAEQIATDLERLQASLERLRILADAWQEALLPYRKIRTYFGR